MKYFKQEFYIIIRDSGVTYKVFSIEVIRHVHFPEKYVAQNLTFDLRSCIAQLRFGDLSVHVETGRFSTKSRDQRVCKICN